MRGGAERVFLAESYLMESHGNKVHVFARQHPNNLASKYDKFFPREMVTDSIKPSFRGLQSLSQYFYSLNAKRCLSSMMENINFEIAHAHNIHGRLTTSVLDLLYQKNIPVLMTLHDYKLICPNYKLMYDDHICEDCKDSRFLMAIWNMCHKNSIVASTIVSLEAYFNHLFGKYRNKVQCFISPSIFLKRKLVEFGWPQSQIVYIPNFVEVTKFHARYISGKYFLYIGRLSPEKGIPTLIKAFMKIASKKITLYVAGEGPFRNNVESMAAADSRIRFTGHLAGKTLEEITRNALAVVVPSEWYENAPISVLEALAFGKPVVGARIGGIPEMIKDGVNGYLFTPGHVDDLCEKLEFPLSMSEENIRNMGQAARQKVEREYNPELHYERLIELYSNALSG